jgi:hypothetical protein
MERENRLIAIYNFEVRVKRKAVAGVFLCCVSSSLGSQAGEHEDEVAALARYAFHQMMPPMFSTVSLQ